MYYLYYFDENLATLREFFNAWTVVSVWSVMSSLNVGVVTYKTAHFHATRCSITPNEVMDEFLPQEVSKLPEVKFKSA